MTEAFAPVSSMRVFMAILMRDITVARRQIGSFLTRTALQPILFAVIFGFVMPKMNVIPHGYTTLMIPGIVALSLTLSAVQSVALPMVAEFGYTKEIEDRLLAPIPTSLVAAEKIVAGALQGLIAAAVVLPIARLIVGPIPGLTFSKLPLLIVITIFSGTAFSALGLFLGTGIAPQQIGLMFSVIIAPMIMFGCTYYPWSGLSAIPVLKYVVLINPLVYASEGMRATLTPSVPHMPLPAILIALVGITAGFTWAGMRSFMKRAIS